MTIDGFLKIAITLPEVGIKEESKRILQMLQEESYDYIHIRKPMAAKDEVRRLLDSIPESLHPFLWLNDWQELASEYNVAGIHLNSRIKVLPPTSIKVTTACHSIEDLESPLPASNIITAYRLLSPVYDSISKPGYKSHFNIRLMSPVIRGKRVVALGGVTPDKFQELKEAGFIGGAMLGAAWR